MLDQALFAPDIFSRPRPAYAPATTEEIHNIKHVLGGHYCESRITIESAEGLVGLEINSRNYRIIAQDGRIFALKRARKDIPAADFELQLSIAQALNDAAIPLPRILPADNGRLSTRDSERRIWVLSEFTQGMYFTGQRDEMNHTVQAIAILQQALEMLPSAQSLPLSASAAGWPSTADSLQHIFSRPENLGDFFPESEAIALRCNLDSLREAVALTGSYKYRHAENIVPTHIDLHPHNILIPPGGGPVIVDLDSLQRADRTQSLCFAVFKLGRQQAVTSGPVEAARAVAKFLRQLDLDVDSGRRAAEAEILRRISIIVDLNLNHGNTQWNSVLQIQLKAMHEVPHLFKLAD